MMNMLFHSQDAEWQRKIDDLDGGSRSITIEGSMLKNKAGLETFCDKIARNSTLEELIFIGSWSGSLRSEGARCLA